MSVTTVSLEKGEKIDLTKDNPGLKVLGLGLGWDVKKENGTFDLDAFALTLRDGKYKGGSDMLYFGQKVIPGLKHSGDNLTGVGDGDDETIICTLAEVPGDAVILGANIYQAKERKQNLGQVKKAFIRVYDAETKQEIRRFDLSEDFSSKTGIILGRVYKHNGEWKFEAVGDGVTGDLNEIAAKFV